MKSNNARAAKLLAVLSVVLFTLAMSAVPAMAGGEPTPLNVRTVEAVQTNWTTRYVTNVIEVRAPQNIFVTEFRTNLTQRSVTNAVAVDVFRTNFVTRYDTNYVARYETNWVTRSVTNLTTLSLTNWETVVATRTNWIRQPMTNFIDVNIPLPTVAAVPPATATPEAKPVVANESLALDVERTAKPASAEQVEMKFKLRLTSDSTATLQVQQWRVERQDGAVFVLPPEQEFKRALPPGRYVLQVKARKNSESPMFSLRTNLDVARDGVAKR
jgi:hypothetical protein